MHLQQANSSTNVRVTTLPEGECWHSPGDFSDRVHVVLKGNCTFGTEGGDLDISESYAAYIPRGEKWQCRSGVKGAMVARLDFGGPVSQTVENGSSRLSFERIEDSHSYYLISRLLSAHYCGHLGKQSLALIAALGRHLRNLFSNGFESGDQAVVAVMEDIHNHALRTVSLDQFADLVRLHPMTLARRFRQWRGCSIGEFRQRVRAERAFYRVIKTPNPLSELSLACGFADQSHMTRQFRRFFGTTPSRLRSATRSAPFSCGP